MPLEASRATKPSPVTSSVDGPSRDAGGGGAMTKERERRRKESVRLKFCMLVAQVYFS